jgi:hypothetical protein
MIRGAQTTLAFFQPIRRFGRNEMRIGVGRYRLRRDAREILKAESKAPGGSAGSCGFHRASKSHSKKRTIIFYLFFSF